MAVIKPFRGIRFNQARVKNFADVSFSPRDIQTNDDVVRLHLRPILQALNVVVDATDPQGTERVAVSLLLLLRTNLIAIQRL